MLKRAMPKIVDRDQRRRDLGEAVWRVIRREGVEHASVRNVASEAGLSTGSLRHFFASQAELQVFAMQLVIDRVEDRVARTALPPDPLAAAKLALTELLPLDEDRAAENQVWVAFTARAMVDERLRVLQHDAYNRLRRASRAWIDRLLVSSSDELRDLETERLFALIDGLAVHAAIRPDQANPDRLRAVLNHHLDDLARTEGHLGEELET